MNARKFSHINRPVKAGFRGFSDCFVHGSAECIKGGRVLDYNVKPDRQLCRLFMSMMDKVEVRPKTFGDAKQMLQEV